jgi:nitrogen regulatory protein P-II 1
MKLLHAIIQPPKLQAVLAALHKIAVQRVTVCETQGYGRQRGHAEIYRGREYKSQLLRKVMLEIVVNDDFVERTIETIRQTAQTGPDGSFGDGKILAVPVLETIQISDGSRGKGAV